MRLVAFVGLLLLTGCSYFQSSKEVPKAASGQKSGGVTEMTCYQDCRNDLQTEQFCRERCSD